MRSVLHPRSNRNHPITVEGEVKKKIFDAEETLLLAYSALRNPPLDKIFDNLRSGEEAQWSATSPKLAKPLKGSTLKPLDGNSILATGESPDQDIYEVILHEKKTPMRAIRLVAIPDPSSEDNWIGRSTNDNFLLSEIEVDATRPRTYQQFEPVELVSASATYLQGQCNVSHAIDGHLDTSGWAIYGSVATVQAATFVLAQAVVAAKNVKTWSKAVLSIEDY